ncbi:MAG TPA: hypothetical protein VFZ21_24860 [Gemmatimonadaceae bacterium]|nr:hypothetical protein [Gemmatimonadaceae bacterium]
MFLEANPIVIGILAFLAIAALVLSVLAILMSRAGVRAASAPPFGAAELAQMTIIPPRTDGSR